MQTLIAQINPERVSQVSDGMLGIVGIIVAVFALALLISWLLLPWLVVSRLDKISKQLGRIHDEIEPHTRNGKDTSSVRYPR
jgi:hypothetical protein